MNVLGVASPFVPVAPDSVGGAEQIAGAIDLRLVREDHNSLVLAASGSRVAGRLVTIPPHTGWIDGAARARAREAYSREIEQLCKEHAIELVHYHGHDYVEYAPPLDIPQIATLHLPRAMYAADPAKAPQIARICVSQSQRAGFEPHLEIATVIENGIPVERYRPAANRQDFVLALGRICPEKGFEHALAAAHRAGLPLVLAGGVLACEAHHRYALEVLSPLFDGDRRWIGPVAGERKRQLLAEARCLVIASELDAPSSLVAMEALASGTPVVALARGALPEIVEHGVTGVLVDDLEALPEAIVQAATLSSATCRERAVQRFAASRMTSRYLDVYRSVVRPRRRRTGNVVISIATSDREVAAMAEDWDALCDRCPDVTVFQRPGWGIPWRRWFGGGAEPRVAVIRRGSRLAGVIPLELRDHTLRLIGEGLTDHLDAIVEPEIDPSTVNDAVTLAALGAHHVELAALRPTSRLRDLSLGGALADGIPSPVVALDAAKIPQRLDYEQRRLARMAPRWLDENDDVAGLLDTLIALHHARWAINDEPGMLADPASAGFHRDVVSMLGRRGFVRMIGLALDGVVRAVLYGFLDHGRFQLYLSAFDPQIGRLSPGRLLIARAIDRACDDGAFELDFLRGQQPAKYEWGAHDRPAASYRAELGEDLRARAEISLDER